MKKRSRTEATLEITALVDVIFLLLIFFMSSTVFKKDELTLLMGLPKSDEGVTTESQKDKPLKIELTTDELAFEGSKTNLEELKTALLSITKKETPIELRIDKGVVYERIVEILELIKQAGLTNLGLITEKR